MSGFDELADEIPDEDWDAAWAAYTTGADPVAGGDALRGFIELPLGVIEVRGDDIGLTNTLPRARLDAGTSNLTDPDAILDISGRGPVNWSLTNRRSGLMESGSCVDATDVIPALLAAQVRLDEDNVYLDLQMVDNGRIGVGLVDVSGDAGRGDDHGLWLGSEWVVLTNDLVVVRPGSRTVTCLRVADSRTTRGQLRIERSTIDVLVFIGPAGRESYSDGHPDDEQLDTVRTLFERVRLPRRSLSFEEVSLITTVVGEVVADALSLPVSKADMDDVPTGLSSLAHQRELSRLTPGDPERRRWRDLAASTLAPIAHMASNSVTLPHNAGHAVLIGPALDVIDRGAVGDRSTSGRPEHPSSDAVVSTLDFLVGPDDREEFEANLIRAGLQPSSGSLTNRDLKSTSRRSFALPADSGRSGLTIATTTTIGTGLYAGLLDLEDFHTMSVPIRVGSAWVRGLSPSHRFIFACIQFASGEYEQSSRSMVLNNVPWNTVSAARTLRLADRCGALTPVRNTVRELWQSFPSVLRPVLEELGD